MPDTDATAVTYRKGSYLFLEADETGTDAAPGTVHFASPPGIPPPPPPLRTKWTRRVPHPVLIGHAASLTPY